MSNAYLQTPGMSKYRPLNRIICYDDFDNGTNGWVDLTPNFVMEDFGALPGALDRTSFGPAMLSTATFPRLGTHGSMDGIYSLKVSTRANAARYEEKPAPGSLGLALKRLTVYWKRGPVQFEMFYTFRPDQDRPGLGEKDVRAFGFLFDIQDSEYRYFPAIRYVNSVNGEMKQQWQYSNANDVTNLEWAYGYENDSHVVGVDPQMYGRRYPDGSTDGFKPIPNATQELCYNESDDKINWHYFRLVLDLAKREYVEFQSGEDTYDMRGLAPTLVEPYARIRSLINPLLWIETDTDRRAFLLVDSAMLSADAE